MRKRIPILFMTMVIVFTLITPGLVPRAEAAGGTVTKAYTATKDTMELNGHIQYDGIHDNDGDGFLSIGRSNDEFGNVRQRAGITFDLGVPEGIVVSAELVLTVATVIRNPDHTLYMEVRGSAENDLNYVTFPSLDTNSPYADKFTAKSTAEVPMGTYLQNQSITFNVKSAVDAFTDISDRKITFMLNGNETDADSGWFSIHSLETYVNAFRPKLVVTYETGPVNTPPTGSFTIMEGAMTGTSTVNLSVTGSDPDAGDSVTHMRFANSAANLSAASWLPFSNTATFSLTGGDGAKTIYMQLRDSNNAISSNSSQTILLDQTAPIGTLIINDGASWTKSSTVTLKGTYSDGSGSGVEQVRLSNINGTWQTSWFSIADLNGRSWVLPAGEGAKTVYVQYKDRVGNSSSSTISSTIAVDTIAPTITNVVNNKVYNSRVTPVFNEGTGLLNGAPFTSGTEIMQDGTYTLIVTDSAGNNAMVSFQIDTASPIVAGVANGGIYNINKVITFNKGTATLNGAAFSSGTQVTLDGVYTLVVTDAVGNVTRITFEIDKIAPIVTGITNGGSYKEQVTIRFNEGTATLNGAAFATNTEIDQDGVYTLVVTDAAGNVTTISFTIDTVAPTITGVSEGGVYKTVTPSFNEGTAELNGTPYISGTEIDQDGAYTLVVTDVAGNATTVQFQIDATSPTGTVIIQAGAEWTNATDAKLTLTSNDGNNGSGVEEMRFSNNGSDWSGWEPSAITKTWSLVPGDGEKTVYVQFKDKVGNMSETISDVIKLDQTIPTGTILINSGVATTSSKLVTLTLTSSDGTGSGVTDMRFSGDNLTWLNWENVLPTKNWSFTGSSGLKNLYVQFRDAAGNVSVANMASITYQEISGGSNGGASGSIGSIDNTSGGTGSIDIPSSSDVVISTGTKTENAAKVDIKMVEGKKVTTVFLEEAQLKGMLNESDNKPVITIKVRNHSDTVNWEMNAALLQSLENNNAAIQVYTENVVYTVPLSQVSVNKWRNQLGADIPLKDVKIKVEITILPNSAFVFKKVGDGQVSLVGPPVRFSIKGLYGNKELELNQFDTFVERRVAIPEGIDPKRITTGVKLMSDGTIVHIPTKVIREGGRDYAILNSMTNSIYALIYHQKTFTDISKHWAQESINDLASRLVINGADEQRFLPESEITRAEFMAIIIRALGLNSANKTFDFKDVAEEAWYHQAIQIGYSYGLIDGLGDGFFKPNEKITRQETMVILSRALKLAGLNKEIDSTKRQKLVNQFADRGQLATWAQQAAALTVEIGVIGGYKGKLLPLQNITRAETAAIIQRFLQKAEFI